MHVHVLNVLGEKRWHFDHYYMCISVYVYICQVEIRRILNWRILCITQCTFIVPYMHAHVFNILGEKIDTFDHYYMCISAKLKFEQHNSLQMMQIWKTSNLPGLKLSMSAAIPEQPLKHQNLMEMTGTVCSLFQHMWGKSHVTHTKSSTIKDSKQWQFITNDFYFTRSSSARKLSSDSSESLPTSNMVTAWLFKPCWWVIVKVRWKIILWGILENETQDIKIKTLYETKTNTWIVGLRMEGTYQYSEDLW